MSLGICNFTGIFTASDNVIDRLNEISGNGGRGKVGKAAHLEEAVVSLKSKTDGETVFRVNFEWDESQGIPGAVLVRNHQTEEVFLKTLTLEGVPGKGTVVFVANSWIYPQSKYRYNRVFFANDVSSILFQFRPWFVSKPMSRVS